MIHKLLRNRLVGRSWYKWLALGLVTNLGIQNFLDRFAVNSLFPLLRRDLGATDVELGLLGTAFLITYAILSPLAGALGDRSSRRRVLLASLLLWSTATFLSGFAAAVVHLVVLRVLLAVGQVSEIPVGQAMVADFHSRETRARATSIHLGGTNIGTILSGIVAGYVGQYFGWRAVFRLLGAIGLASWFVYYYLLADPKERPFERRSSALDRQTMGGLQQILKSPAVWAIMGMFFFTGLANWTVMTWLPLYLYEEHGRTLVQAGFEANFLTQISGASILAWAWLSDRWSRRDRKGCVWTQVIGLSLGILVFLWLGMARSQWSLVICMLGAGVVMAAIDATTMPVLCEAVAPDQRASAYGFLNLCGTLAGAIASYLVGLFMKRIGLGAMMSWSSVFYLAAAAVMAWAGARAFSVDRQTATCVEQEAV